MQGLLCSVHFKLGTVVVFFLMCKIPSPSLLFAITLWKAGLALCWLSASSLLTRALESLASTVWLFALWGIFFFSTFPSQRRVCSLCFGNKTTCRELHGLCKGISARQVVCFGLAVETLRDSCLLPCCRVL